ncbi:MAG TPA: SRPBCC family protein [Solirubrobacteraceae bacterium]|nr:SRPBCC family protein [Solirubrobacteraceae bacterium]
MPESDEVLDISALGARVVLRPSGSNAESRETTFDVIGRPRGFVAQPHVHTDQIEHFEVLSGEMLLVLDRRRHVLRQGDRMSVQAGKAHRQLPSGAGDAHVRVTVSPAGRTEEFLRRIASLSRTGRFTRQGFPKPVAAARLILEFGDTGHAAFPPVPVQRLLANGILAVAGLWREYAFVDEWDVAAPVSAVFEALADTRTYPDWWRPVYLDVEADGAPALGTESHQHFKGRLPYHLRTRSRITRFEPDHVIEAEVDGDLRGHGVWTVTPTDTGSHVRFEWTVHADRRLLRALTPFMRPALRANHAWAIGRAIDGLEPYLSRRESRRSFISLPSV